MTIENEIRTQLQASTGVTGLASTRVYYMRLPEGATLPAVTYQRVSRTDYPVYGGVVSLVSRRMQIDSWAESGQSAVNLAVAVRKSLNGYSGTPSSLEIKGIFIIDETSMYEVETGLHRIRQDYEVHHVEDVA